jgi:putative DNA primase/helicase
MNNAASIARALRGRRCSDGYLCHCPLSSHGRGRGDRSPSLIVKDGTHAVLFKCFAGCDSNDILQELRRRRIAGERSDEGNERPIVKECPPEHLANAEALELWHSTRVIATDSMQAQYLRSRGVSPKPPPSIRAASILHLDKYPLPAIVAAVQAPDRRIIAAQKTLIDPRGDRKAQVRLPRMTIGALGWGAVRLAAATEVLGIAEGTEKALAAMQLFEVPCWSSLGASRMHRLWIPDCVRKLHIFLDNDDAGRAAAERTAHAHRHREVLLRFPPEQFKDWDDVTLAQAERSAA